ncbi:MAG: hypothetical protein WCT06_06140 [Armatimonadota bacterium]
MNTKKNQVSIAVKRPQRTPDGAGGFTVEMQEVTGSPYAGRLLRKKDPIQVNSVAADMIFERLVLVFPPNADIRAEDICTVGRYDWRVRFVRGYSRSLQVDVEAVVQ